MIVMKFGGTSTQDAAAMLNVTQIVRTNRDKKPVVVISAIAKATNLLEMIGKLARENKIQEANEILINLLDRHRNILDLAVKNPARKSQLISRLTSVQNEITDLIKGVAIIQELTPKTLDRFYSYGELLSSSLVAAIMQEAGLDAVWIDTKDFMTTDNNFNRAMPIVELVEQKLQALALDPVNKDKILVTQGFIGATISGERTTMGRESSDYSAAVIGAALNAEDVQIWTDVDGILTGDPNLVDNPKKNKVLSFDEAYELSLFGAKVLHPNTMLPALDKNIPIHVFNSKRPNLSGTLVTHSNQDAEHSEQKSILKSITYKKGITLINVVPRQRYSRFVFWEHIYNVFTEHNITPLLSSTSESKYAAAISSLENLDSLLHEISEIGTVNLDPKLALVSLIGDSIRRDSKILEIIMREISGIDLIFISFGVSESSFNFLINEEYVETVVRKLHKVFFENALNKDYFESLTVS
jgi:aspartate kinase